MELRQLEQFVAVAELGTFTRAAAQLHVVQSGVSAAVATLEHELGVRLFDRGSRGVRLTPAGATFLPAARETLEASQRARQSVTHFAGSLTGEVTFGTMASIAVVDLPALLASLRQHHPGIQVRLRTSPTGSGGLIDEVIRGDLDAALVANDGSAIPGIRMQHLLTTPIVALLRADHPLADRSAVALAELAAEPFIDFPAGFGNRQVVDATFARLGLERTVAVEVSDVSDAAAYVQHGLGVSLVPALFQRDEIRGVRAVLVHRPQLPWVLSVGVSAIGTLRPTTRAVLELVPRFTRVPGGDDATAAASTTDRPAARTGRAPG
jgi:DNA-binding transcriptional LysR family regulator